MRNNFIPSVLLAGLLCAGLVLSDAAAGPCAGNEPCGPPGQLERLREREIFAGEQLTRRAIRKRRRQRHIDVAPEPFGYGEPDQVVQTYDADPGLIGPTEALTQALAVVPGSKPLGVKLLKGPNPVYAVKLRVRGKVRRILVDARTAEIVGE